MLPNEKTNDPYEQREIAGDDYWNDPRWEEVRRLRSTGNQDDYLTANGLVFQIHDDWGVD